MRRPQRIAENELFAITEYRECPRQAHTSLHTSTMSTNIINDHQHEEEEQEIYWEECSCGVHLGGKLFHDEEEFDEHPDRAPGYNADGEWRCAECRGEDEDEDSTSKCEDCGYIGDSVIVHDWGCVALCEVCSNKDGEPHCPRTSRSGEAEKCEYCVAQWTEEDE